MIQNHTATAQAAQPIAFVSTAYLAQRVRGVHGNIMTTAKTAAKHFGRSASRTATRPFQNNRNEAVLEVSAAVVGRMAENAAKAGKHGTAGTYREIAAGMRAGALPPVARGVDDHGRTTFARNPASAEQTKQAHERRVAAVGIVPAFEQRHGRLGVTHIAAALFAGTQSKDLLRSCDAVAATITGAADTIIFPIETKFFAARGQTAERTARGWFLTAEALEAIALRFDECSNATGRARAGAYRNLARQLCATEAGTDRGNALGLAAE